MLSSGTLNTKGIDFKYDELFSIPKHYWEIDAQENKNFFKTQVGEDMPAVILKELDDQARRIDEELFA